jgi:hypothetical protein
VQYENLFQDSNITKSYLTQIRGFSLQNNEIKMIRRVYYSSNNFQDSNKRKRTEKKTMGYTSGKRAFGLDPLVPASIWAGTKGPATSPQNHQAVHEALVLARNEPLVPV